MPRRPTQLTWDRETIEHLDAHGTTVRDAIAAFENEPLFFEQARSLELTDRGTFRMRPPRLRMVGPDNAGGFFTFILERPDTRGCSRIVTGWATSEDEAETYELEF